MLLLEKEPESLPFSFLFSLSLSLFLSFFFKKKEIIALGKLFPRELHFPAQRHLHVCLFSGKDTGIKRRLGY